MNIVRTSVLPEVSAKPSVTPPAVRTIGSKDTEATAVLLIIIVKSCALPEGATFEKDNEQSFKKVKSYILALDQRDIISI